MGFLHDQLRRVEGDSPGLSAGGVGAGPHPHHQRGDEEEQLR